MLIATRHLIPSPVSSAMNSVSELRLCDIASPAVLTVAPDTPLDSAIQKFADEHVSCLVVVEAGKPVGIVTERDLLRLICADKSKDLLISAVMSAPLLTARFDLDFSAAQLMMSNRAIRHLVLVDALGELKGVASDTDFRRHLGNDLFQAIQSLGAVMEQGVEPIAPDQPLAFALQTMSSRQLDHIIVGRNGRAEGILTERDVPRLLVQHVDTTVVTVGEVMSHPLHTIRIETSVAAAAQQMEQRGLRHLVVIDAEGGMLGVVTQHRMLERLVSVLVEESRSHLESQLGVVLEASGVGSWEFDHRRDILIRSAGLNKVLKFPAEKIFEKLDDVLARIDSEDREQVAAAFHAALIGHEQRFSLEYRVLGGDGKPHWVSSRGYVIKRDRAGKPLRSAGVVIDIDAQKASEWKLHQSEARFRNLMENLPMPVVYMNARQELVFTNQHFKNFFGYTLQDIPDVSTWAVFAYPDETYRKWALETWDESLRLAADNGGVIRPVDYQVRCKNGSTRNVEISGINLNEGLLTTFIDVTERRQEQALLEFSNAILQHISIGAPLADVLDFILREIEDCEPETHCSVLLLDESSQQLRHGAAPSLPREYCQAIDGVAIGPFVGSCGTAAFLGETVFVADIASDPLWENYKQLALKHDLAACWSSPIISSAGKVLGTFAVYWGYAFPEVSPLLRRYVETATALAAIAIEGVQRAAELHGMVSELRRWQHLTLGREGRVLELKREVNALLVRQGEAPRYGSVAEEGGAA